MINNINILLFYYLNLIMETKQIIVNGTYRKKKMIKIKKMFELYF